MFNTYEYLALITVTIGQSAGNEKSNEDLLVSQKILCVCGQHFGQLFMQSDKKLWKFTIIKL